MGDNKVLTVTGFITRVYHNMIQSSKRRNHPPPEFTKDELREWFLKNKFFYTLWNNWVFSGFDRMSAPSADRLDNSIGYIFSNMELKTWGQNLEKDIVNNSKKAVEVTSKPVLQLNSEGNVINEYPSIREASRVTGIDRSNISMATIRIRRKSAGGYQWKFKNNKK